MLSGEKRDVDDMLQAIDKVRRNLDELSDDDRSR
jgi:hypothetical protein